MTPPLDVPLVGESHASHRDLWHVEVTGLRMRYTVEGSRLMLKATRKQKITAEIRVAVDDANGYRAEMARCFRYEPKCTRKRRVIPNWNDYRLTYMKNFGIREVPYKQNVALKRLID